MKKILLMILISIPIILNNALSYNTNQFIINNIHINGAQRIPTKAILSNLPFHAKDTITDDDIAHAIKILFNTKYFENIKILKDNDTLIIQVKEYPMINHIFLSGNRIIKKNILKNNLKLQGIQKGGLFNPHNIFTIDTILKNFYYDLGKYNATIKTTITHLSDNRINLKITFNEGTTTNVQKINIIGNQKFNLNKLLSLFQLNNKICKYNIPIRKKYQKKILMHDLQSLQSFYLNKGFVKFNIDSTQIRLTPDRKNVYIAIYITEGLQYKISTISISGKLSHFSHKIHSLITINSGELYNDKKIQNIIHNIKTFLGQHGYINPIIITDIETDDTTETVKLYLNINIGKCFYVKQIKFSGNFLTEDTVLRREIRQMESTWVNNNLIKQGQERLNRTGYFEFVKVHTEYIPAISDQVNIIYKVKERNNGSMNINIGIGTESGINFQCGVQQENLFGTGNSFILNATKNNYQTYTELSASQPHFTTNNISFEEKIFYNGFRANHADLADYGLKSYGTYFSIGFPMNEHNILNFGIDYMYNHLSNIKPQIAVCRYLNSQGLHPKKIIFNNKNTKNSNNTIKFHDMNFSSKDLFFKLNWKRNTLNHAYFPTYGMYSDYSGKITFPGSNNKYYKFFINSNHYIPLHRYSEYWILMTRIYTGYSAGLYGRENPFYDNFYSSGTNIVRGFRHNTIGPKAAYYTCTSKNKTYDTCTIKNSQDAIGGNAIIILKGELVVPPPFLNKTYINIIRTSIFVDLGTIWDTYWENTAATRVAGIPNYKKANNIRISNGLAIQWMSPIGPVVFSYAKLIKKYPGDKIEQFQFNIGKLW